MIFYLEHKIMTSPQNIPDSQRRPLSDLDQTLEGYHIMESATNSKSHALFQKLSQRLQNKGIVSIESAKTENPMASYTREMTVTMQGGNKQVWSLQLDNRDHVLINTNGAFIKIDNE